LRNTDTRLADGRTVTPAFLYAALLWPPLQKELEKYGNERGSLSSQQEAANRVIGQQLKTTSIPKRFSIAMREIWELQLRLSVRSRRGAENVYAHPRFRAAYDFLLLREEAGEQTDGLGRWWTDFQNTDKGQQERMLEELGKGAPRP